jgi:two-component system LytT family response regulator
MIISAVLVDDEEGNNGNLRALLQKHCPQVRVLGDAVNFEEAVRLIDTLKPNLLFLDIHMGAKSGFELLQSITHRNFEVIFVTAYSNYGIQAVKFAALDYLLKPIDTEELIEAVSKAEIKLKSLNQNAQLDFLIQQVSNKNLQPQRIALPMFNEVRYVLIEDIVHCQADNTYTYFHLNGQDKLLVSKSLKEYSDLLKPQGFLRTHQSHLVNPKFVKSWLKEDGGVLLLLNNTKIPVSKPNREAVRAALNT